MKDDGDGATRVSLVREEGYRFRVHCGTDGAATILTDETPPLGAGAGPNPTALLAAAVGNCLASSLLFCMQKARLEVGGFEAEVSASTVRDPEGRLRIGGLRVCLAPTVSPEVRGKMGRCQELFERFCTVTESIRRGIEVTVAVEPRVVAPAGARCESAARPPCASVGAADPRTVHARRRPALSSHDDSPCQAGSHGRGSGLSAGSGVARASSGM